MWERGRSSDSGLPLCGLPGLVGQWRFRVGRLPSQRRDRPGIAPGSLTVLLCGAGAYHSGVWTSAAVRLWVPVVLWAAVIFAFSSVPDLGTGLGTWDLVLRKLAHAAEFAVLGALLLRALRDERAAVAAGVAYAITDEVHQHFVPGRLGSPVDVAIDAAGVAVGVILCRRYVSR
jgi:VanZ family protein